MIARFALFIATLLLVMPAFAAEPDSQGLRVVVPARDIARGELISESDLVYGTLPASAGVVGVVTTMDALSGMEARRVLRAGETVRPEDVRHPILVTRGSTVTMTFEAPGISVTAMGKATSEGGMGETISVQNVASYRQVSAVVIGPGQVRAIASGTTINPATRVVAAAQ
jgi:flagella basal body P-ring formation protein FlgA